MFKPCIVLNASREPLAVVPAERALVLVWDGRAEVLESHPTAVFRSQHQAIPVPTKIILKSYRKTGSKYYGPAQLNQRNLFLRDGHRCQYCGKHATQMRNPTLTRDHVLPLSRGGKDVWNNVVTCCSPCNHRKDNKTPEEADMTLLKKPYAPTVAETLAKRTSTK